MRAITLLTLGAIGLVLTVMFLGFSDIGEEKKPQPPKVEEFPIEIDEPNYCTTETNQEDAVGESYWFVKYEAPGYRGYGVYKLNTEYFDTYAITLLIYPNFVKTDYVGIDFFQKVPKATYDASERNKNKME